MAATKTSRTGEMTGMVEASSWFMELQEILYVMRERGADRFGLSFGGRPPFCRIAVGSNAMPEIRAARPHATFCSKWNRFEGGFCVDLSSRRNLQRRKGALSL